MNQQPRYDGLGIAMLGLAALLLVGLAMAGSIQAPKPPDDSSVQQSMAWANWAMVVVSLAGGVIGALSLYLIYRTLQAAQRSAVAAEMTVRETRLIGRAQTQAYLSIDGATYQYDDILSEFSLTYSNAGQSPALSLRVALVVTSVPKDENGEKGAEEVDDEERTIDKDLWPSVASGKTNTRAVLLFKFDPAPRLAKLPTGWTLDCSFVATITYRDVFGDEHSTSALYWHSFESTDELGKLIEFRTAY